jgi:hypothetical protein
MMYVKRFWFAVLAMLIVSGAGIALTQSRAGAYGEGPPPESYIRTVNETKEGVWITVYSPRLGGDKIEGAWAVPAGKDDTHGLRAVIITVRAELRVHNCAPLDRTISTNDVQVENGKAVRRVTGYVKGDCARYTFTK